MEVRLAGQDDMAAALQIFDARVAWLVARGRSGQWGERPFSDIGWFVDRFATWVEDGSTWVAVDDAGVAGTVTVTGRPEYAPPIDAAELYVHALVTRDLPAVPGLGGVLLDHAEQVAVRQGVELVRLDCWAGGDRALIRYYEQRGYTVDGPVLLNGWRGVVLRKTV
jgi:GNAT superfamily N-acetyltransferase